jgi:hypothetical protein
MRILKDMDSSDEPKPGRASRANWIAAGFLVAFAASVFTVIFTGLKAINTSPEFDSGFRSVTLAPGDVREIELMFDSPARYAAATLFVTLPSMLDFAEGSGEESSVGVVPGSNHFTVAVEAREAGSGYLIARVEADEPVGLYRVFVTVADSP